MTTVYELSHLTSVFELITDREEEVFKALHARLCPNCVAECYYSATLPQQGTEWSEVIQFMLTTHCGCEYLLEEREEDGEDSY